MSFFEKFDYNSVKDFLNINLLDYIFLMVDKYYF